MQCYIMACINHLLHRVKSSDSIVTIIKFDINYYGIYYDKRYHSPKRIMEVEGEDCEVMGTTGFQLPGGN